MPRMSKRKFLSAAGGLLLFGSTASKAYDSVDADRTVNLQTSKNSSLISIETKRIYHKCGNKGKGRRNKRNELATITNNTGETAVIEAYITENNMKGVTIQGKKSKKLNPNEKHTFYVKIPCKYKSKNHSKPESIEFGIISDGENIDIESIRESEVI